MLVVKVYQEKKFNRNLAFRNLFQRLKNIKEQVEKEQFSVCTLCKINDFFHRWDKV